MNAAVANLSLVAEGGPLAGDAMTVRLGAGLGLPDLSIGASDCGQYLMLTCGGELIALVKVPASGPSPRYGVTYEDHVIPEERYLGVASSTIKVIDLETKEVLGELIRYAWSPGAPSRVNPSPWLTAYKCPGHAVGADSATRKFVDQVLIPAKEK